MDNGSGWDGFSEGLLNGWIGTGIVTHTHITGLGFGLGLSRIALLTQKITGVYYGIMDWRRSHNWDGSKLHFPVPVPIF